MRTIIGIDPGLDGGLAAIRGDTLIRLERMPTWTFIDGERHRLGVDGAAVAELVQAVSPDVVYLENCYGWRGDRAGPQAAFGFGGAWWVLMDRLQEADIEYHAIQPRIWQKALLKGCRSSREDTKSAAIRLATTLYPAADLTPGRCTTPHAGLADALCLAFYGRIQAESPINHKPPTVRRAPVGRRRA